ncbi:MAG: hypothetical protein M3O88_05200, partial [Actinomycetota bacterium]|nr:hypothetical protein [Actinomycetota bacterium]
GVNGGLLGYRPNPSGHLLDVPSPTQLDPPRLLGNYAIAFVIVFGLITVPLGLVRRRGATPLEPGGSTDEALA